MKAHNTFKCICTTTVAENRRIKYKGQHVISGNASTNLWRNVQVMSSGETAQNQYVTVQQLLL